LVHQLVAFLSQGSDATHNQQVGDRLFQTLDLADAARLVTIRDPSGGALSLRPAVDPRGANVSFDATRAAGIYSLSLAGDRAPRAVAAVAVWIIFFYRREGSRVRAFYRLALIGLRLAAILVLLVVFFQPMLALSRVETTRSVVAVLIDRSRSMGIRDRWQSAAARQRMARAVGSPQGPQLTRAQALAQILRRPDVALLPRLSRTHQLRTYAFGSDLRPL